MPKTIAFVALKDSTFKHLALLKELNLFSEVYEGAATALGLTELAERFGSICREHLRAGWMTPAVESRRRAAYEELLASARKLLSAGQYDQLYRCF